MSAAITRRRLLLLSALALAPHPPAWSAPLTMNRHEFAIASMGSTFRIVVCCDDPSLAQQIVKDQLGHVELVFDEARADSEVARLHANAGLGAFRVSNTFYDFIRQAQKLADLTHDAFNITAGPLVAQWKDAIATEKLPAREDVVRARKLVRSDKLILNPISRTAHLTEPGMRLDVESAWRGYACDQIVAALRKAGMQSALVDAGGRVAVGEPPPGKPGWRIRVADADPASPHRVIVLARQAVATSWRRSEIIEIGGTAYAPVVNPLVGLGTTNTIPATVVARRAAQADALARAAAVLGETDGRSLVRSIPGVKVWFNRPVTPSKSVPKPAPRPQTKPVQARPASPFELNRNFKKSNDGDDRGSE